MSAKADNRTIKALEIIPGSKANGENKTMLIQVEETDGEVRIPIPNEIAEKFSISAGDAVDIVWENGRLEVRRLDKPLDEIDAMILTITPENRHPEISTGPPRGNEVWS